MDIPVLEYRRLLKKVSEFIVATATTRPEKLGLPVTHWSVRKLASYLARNTARPVAIGRERAAADPGFPGSFLPTDPDREGIG